MKLFIDALNGHRAGEVIATALRLGFLRMPDVEVVYDRDKATAAIFYATLANNKRAEDNIALSKEVPTILLHDDLDIPKHYDSMATISAFTFDFMNCMYYSPFVTRPLTNTGHYDVVYGGTFKPSRIDSYINNIPNEPTTLLIGDDERWTEIAPRATRIATIRDMSVLYEIMSKCKSTFIAHDTVEAAHGHKLPLRAIEPYICGMTDKHPIAEEHAINTIKTLKEQLWQLTSTM